MTLNKQLIELELSRNFKACQNIFNVLPSKVMVIAWVSRDSFVDFPDPMCALFAMV